MKSYTREGTRRCKCTEFARRRKRVRDRPELLSRTEGLKQGRTLVVCASHVGVSLGSAAGMFSPPYTCSYTDVFMHSPAVSDSPHKVNRIFGGFAGFVSTAS